jgi:glycosyltransferase involved in cell wall biosynthesis
MPAGPLRILCISPLFPPLANSEAFCGGKMVLALQKAGVDVVVLRDRPSVTSRLDPSSCWNSLADPNCQIDDSATWNKLWAFLLGGRYLSVNRGRLIRAYLRRALRSHREKPFDLVYSRSLPMYAHIIGYWCSKALGVPWVANMNDPWDVHMAPDAALNPPSWAHGVVSKYWLHKTLASASLTTYPSARLRDFHTRLSRRKHENAIIRHVGWTRRTPRKPPPCFHLVHAGKLMEVLSNRESSSLLRGFQHFLGRHPEARADARMILVGPDDPGSKALVVGLGLQDVVLWKGHVSYEESLRCIDDASVCGLVEGNIQEGIYLPSKVADYAAAGKAILALSPSVGVIADMLPCPGLVRVDPQDVPAIGEAIGHFYRLHKNGRLESECPIDEFISQFTPARVVDTFLRAVHDAIPALRRMRDSCAGQGPTEESAA